MTSPGIVAKKTGDTINFSVCAQLSDGFYAYSKVYYYSPVKEVGELVYCAAVYTSTDGKTYAFGVVAYSLGYYLENQAAGLYATTQSRTSTSKLQMTDFDKTEGYGPPFCVVGSANATVPVKCGYEIPSMKLICQGKLSII